jgi:hypothetical protein
MDEREERQNPTAMSERRRPRDDGDDVARPRSTWRASSPSMIQLGRAGRPPGILAVAIVLFVAIAIVKPWPQTLRPPAPVEPPRAVAARPTPQPTADSLAALRSHCEEPLGWRVYSIERWADQTLRIWRSLQPAVSAVDATDPGIPAIPLGPAVELVGYCSPWDGAERPPADSRLIAWLVPPGASAARATPLDLELIAPRPGSVLGGLFGSPMANRESVSAGPTPTARSERPPASGGDAAGSAPSAGTAGPSGAPEATAIWPGGHVVFELVAPSWQRWWAVDIPPPVAAQPD